jgi:2-polyprenyl-3-methyl-5-hydroxy-6-metoxy-1,4-benzoquinol methylase
LQLIKPESIHKKFLKRHLLSMGTKTVDWPKDDLEFISACPACGGNGVVYNGNLTDIVFKCAPGEWIMNTCTGCGSGFLDPRPTQQSIHRAYDVYYTHGIDDAVAGTTKLPSKGFLGMAINGRLNLLYGLNRTPSSTVYGRLLASIPFVGPMFDPLGRTLHRPPHSGARLLDFGCGDGRFLLFAREMGWNVVGVDFDEKAVRAARKLDLDVRLGGFEALSPTDRFDAITMSHVIEHMHEPRKTLLKCFQLLNAGGILALETPNFDASGRLRFGPFWRGLEVPRHLILFNETSLYQSLKQAGFVNITCLSRNFVSLAMHADSRNLRAGKPLGRKSLKDMLNPIALFDGLVGIIKSDRREFLKFTASKPAGESELDGRAGT